MKWGKSAGSTWREGWFNQTIDLCKEGREVLRWGIEALCYVINEWSLVTINPEGKIPRFRTFHRYDAN